MKPELTPEELLLYWSGEMPDDERTDFETRLADDSAAQAYLRELADLNDEVAALPPQATTRDWSELVEQEADLIELPNRRPAKVIPLWQRRVPQLLAASLVVALTLGWLLQRQYRGDDAPMLATNEAVETVTPAETSVVEALPPVETPSELVSPVVPSRRLSDRLFQSSVRLTTRDRVQSLRERRSNLYRRDRLVPGASS